MCKPSQLNNVLICQCCVYSLFCGPKNIKSCGFEWSEHWYNALCHCKFNSSGFWTVCYTAYYWKRSACSLGNCDGIFTTGPKFLSVQRFVSPTQLQRNDVEPIWPSPDELNPVNLTVRVDAQQVEDTVTTQRVSQHTHITPSETSRPLIPFWMVWSQRTTPLGQQGHRKHRLWSFMHTHVLYDDESAWSFDQWRLSGHIQGGVRLMTTQLGMHELRPASLARTVAAIYIIFGSLCSQTFITDSLVWLEICLTVRWQVTTTLCIQSLFPK